MNSKEKAFKEGMVAGAKPFDEKFEKTNQKLDDLQTNFSEKLEENFIAQDSINDYFNSKINDHEKKELFDLNTMYDIKDEEVLDKNEQEYLVSYLFSLSIRMDHVNEYQQQFIRSVANYLEFNIQGTKVSLEMVENIQKTTGQQAFMQTVLEFLFLSNNEFDFEDEFGDVLSNFMVTPKKRKEIEEQIVHVFNATGAQGIAEKYGFVPQEIAHEMDNSIEDDEKNNDDVTEAEMTEEIITSILQIKSDETKEFRNKELHFRTYVNCEGNLNIDHCVIYYNESEAGDEITVARGAKLSIRDSIVICKGFDENPFITYEGQNEIVLERTTFVDCSHFIKDTITRSEFDSSTFIMNKCKLYNCFAGFFSACDTYDNCDISENMILQEDLNRFNTNKFLMNDLISISGWSKAKIQFRNNVIIETPRFRKKYVKKGEPKICYFKCDRAEVMNCTFDGISVAIEALCFIDCKFENCTGGIRARRDYSGEKSPLIDNCVFVNCTDVIYTADNTSITNCQFISCYNKLISDGSFNGGVKVEFCQFINTRNFLENNWGAWFDKNTACITFVRNNESNAKSNYMKKCVFDGVEMEDNFLIVAAGFKKPSGIVSEIEDCDFRNCSTKRFSGQIIKLYMQYDTILKKNKDFEAIRISNCRGLDKINKENTKAVSVEVKVTSTGGNIIGSTLAAIDATEVGAQWEYEDKELLAN